MSVFQDIFHELKKGQPAWTGIRILVFIVVVAIAIKFENLLFFLMSIFVWYGIEQHLARTDREKNERRLHPIVRRVLMLFMITCSFFFVWLMLMFFGVLPIVTGV